MNNLTLQKDYTIDGQEYQLVLPMNVEILIPRNESVRLLSKVTEGLDYSKLMQAYVCVNLKVYHRGCGCFFGPS